MTVEDFQWIFLWLVLTAVFCVGVFYLVSFIRDGIPSTLEEKDIATLEIFVSVFGLAYAVVVGLLIVDAHSRWHTLSLAFRSELNALSDIYDCLRYFCTGNDKKKVVENIRCELEGYVSRLNDFEWNLMKHSRRGKEAIKHHSKNYMEKIDNVEELEVYKLYRIDKYNRMDPFRVKGIAAIIDEVKKLNEGPGSKSCPWHQTMVDKICDLTSRRTDRLELAEGGLKLYLKVFLIFMSLVIVAGTVFMNIAEEWLHLFMVCSTTAGVVGLYMILEDVDRPFSGFWRIDKKLIEALMDKVNEPINAEKTAS